jgi:hypothetical protein
MRTFLFVLVALLALPRLHGQFVELYGTVTDVNANNVPSSALLLCPGPGCPLALGTTVNSNRVGGGGGITLNFLRLPVVKLGVDVRGSRHSGNDGVNTVLGGLKLTIHLPLLHIRPYVQGSVGYLGTTATPKSQLDGVAGQTTTAKYVAAELFAGLDLPLLRILDLRVVEVGAGHALSSVDLKPMFVPVSDGYALRSGSSTTPTFVTASAGLVLHF